MPPLAKSQTQITIEEAEEIIETYLSCPEYYIIDVLGADPWGKQIEIVQAVFKYKTVAVKTCNAVGKSYIAARIVLTFLNLHPGSIVVTTAPTWRQVTDVLWREIRTAVKKSMYKLTDAEVNQAGLNIDTDWYAVGLSTKYPENFFGYHADHILVVVDEAGGVPEPIFRGVKAITPNANAHILYIGNPTNPSGTFFDAFSNPRIKSFTISAFDTPNFHHVGIYNLDDLLRVMTPPDGVDPLEFNPFADVRWPYAALISPEVVYERYHEWGTDSPAWQSLVLGEFPTQAEQSLIPVDLVLQAMNNDGIDEDTGKTFAELSGWKIPDGPQRYGLDMARFGSDSTVLTPRRGGRVEQQIPWNKADLVESAERVINIIDPTDMVSAIMIDDTGNGGGTTDTLVHKKSEQIEKGLEPYQYIVVPYNFGSKDGMDEKARAKFDDITSFLYWNLRRQFFDHAISLPYEKQLFNELVGRRWGLTQQGKIKVESKDEYKLRTGGKSPDRSDSLALAFAPNTSGSFEIIPEHHTARPTHETPVVPSPEGLQESAEMPYDTAGIRDKVF